MKKIFLLPCMWVHLCFGSIDGTVKGVRKIELAELIYPVLWKKDQLKVMLPILKKCHDRVKEREKEEQKLLEKIEEEVKKAEIEIMTQGRLPNVQVSDKIKKIVEECTTKRNAIIVQNIQDIEKILKAQLNLGQKKTLKLSENNSQKWIEFIRYTFLDSICYEILNSILIRLDPTQREGLK